MITIAKQPSWRMQSDCVEACVTRTGGFLAPVTFDRRGRRIRPFSIAPWAEETKTLTGLPPLLRALRGDFFCLPFGGNETPWRGERHPTHGETANANWQFQGLETRGGRTTLHLRLKTKIRPGQVDKVVVLAKGQNVVYQRHVISGMSGPMSLGHHAMLKFPDRPGSGLISTSRWVFGQVYPGVMERPEAGGYSSLEPGARFMRLDHVPQIAGGFADVSRFPARRGFEDIVLLAADTDLPFAWTTVVFPKERYAWFALKDPRVLASTLLWHSNGGRHYAPWNGRHVNVLGLEEITGHFHDGLAASVRPNSLTRRGITTSHRLNPSRPLAVNYIMAVATIPAGFNHIASIEPTSNGKAVILRACNGQSVRAALDLDFLKGP